MPEALPLSETEPHDLCGSCQGYRILVHDEAEAIARAALEREDGNLGTALAFINEAAHSAAHGDAELEHDLLDWASRVYQGRRERYIETGEEASENLV